MRVPFPVLPALKALSVAVALVGTPAPGLAASNDVAAQVSAQLQAQGYQQVKIRRTLLGKIVVTAEGRGHLREIVIDPRNGALLRDLVRNEDGSQRRQGVVRLEDRDGQPGDDGGHDDGGGNSAGSGNSGGSSGDSGGGDDGDSGSGSSGSDDDGGSDDGGSDGDSGSDGGGGDDD